MRSPAIRGRSGPVRNPWNPGITHAHGWPKAAGAGGKDLFVAAAAPGTGGGRWLPATHKACKASRFNRHMAQFRRWRTDKSPRDCTYAQLEVVPPHELAAIFG